MKRYISCTISRVSYLNPSSRFPWRFFTKQRWIVSYHKIKSSGEISIIITLDLSSCESSIEYHWRVFRYLNWSAWIGLQYLSDLFDELSNSSLCTSQQALVKHLFVVSIINYLSHTSQPNQRYIPWNRFNLKITLSKKHAITTSLLRISL